MPLRSELIRFSLPDGGVEILDLLLERQHTFTPEEARALAELDRGGAAAPELQARLEQAMLLEGPTAVALREGARNSRARARMPAPSGAAAGAWDQALELPAFVARAWREPERWRRLAEDRVACRRLLRLDAFLDPDAAHELRRRVSELPFTHRDGAYVQGHGHDVADELDDLTREFQRGPLHTLISNVMGQTLPERIFLRAWRLAPGDSIASHRDGIHYVTTFSLGLSTEWTFRHGGAIAFGYPTSTGLEISERWLPHLGDLMLFEPTAVAWHVVEPVHAGTRYTLTGHYVAPSYPG